jgi:hypothetical protein
VTPAESSPSLRNLKTGWILIAVVILIVAGGGLWAVIATRHHSPTTTSTTTTTAAVASLPISSLPGGATDDKTLVHEISGSGSRSLPAFTPTTPNLYFQYVCVGKGTFAIVGYFKFGSCTLTRAPIASFYGHQPIALVRTRVIAPSSVHWELYISSGPPQQQ